MLDMSRSAMESVEICWAVGVDMESDVSRVVCEVVAWESSVVVVSS